MSTTTQSYALQYPDGTASPALDWEARRRALDAAPAGTRWYRLDPARGVAVLLGTVRSTMAAYHADVAKVAAALDRQVA